MIAALSELGVFHIYNASTLSAIGAMAIFKGDKKNGIDPPFVLFREIWAAGWTTGFGSALLNPTDVCKVRMQTEVVAAGSQKQYVSFLQTAKKIIVEEGLWGFWGPGIVATCLRDLTYSGIRVGLYPATKQLMYGDNNAEIGLLQKLSVGMITGALGSSMVNPIDLVKIRAQSEAGRLGVSGLYETGLRAGQAPSFSNTIHGLGRIAATEGIAGLYVGTTATTFRAACGTGAQLAAYDHSKHMCKELGLMEEGVPLHILASVLSGLAFATGAAPGDIIKSRVMQTGSKYSGFFDCLIKTVRHEGSQALFKGLWPSVVRCVPLFVICQPMMEQMRLLFGLGYFAT